MAGSGGGTAGAPGARVWLLGGEHPGADRSITWDESFGNLNDPDVLVVDLTTLTERVLARIDGDSLAHARESIADKLLGGGTIVVVTQPHFSIERPGSRRLSNYDILPATLATKRVPPGFAIRAGPNHVFKAYIDAVKKFTFQIDQYSPALLRRPAATSSIGLAEMPGQEVTDNSGNNLGLTLQATKIDYEGFPVACGPGRLVFLPPVSDMACDGIGRILSVYGKTFVHGEVPPPWAAQMSFPKADQMQEEIAELEARAGRIKARASDLHGRRGEILGHRRLLYAKGPELEEAVARAFRTLGFSEAKQTGGADQADCILDMGTGRYPRGLVEVKGADGWTGERDIAQCVKWVDKMRAAEGRWSKPIFVPNQCRRKEYPASLGDRLRFEPNELGYARDRDVCIIPSCVLFEAVRRTIGGEVPDKARMIEKIASADGPLECVFCQ